MFNQEVGLLLYQGCLTKHNTEKGSLYWRFIGWCKFVSCQVIFETAYWADLKPEVALAVGDVVEVRECDAAYFFGVDA